VLWSGHPAWKAQIGFLIRWGAAALIPAIVAIIAPLPGGTFRWIGLSAILLLLVVAIAGLERARTFYAASTERVVVRRGILSRHLQSTSFERVQNVNLEQTFFDRLLGVGAVDFDTAGTGEGSDDFRFSGVSDPSQVMNIVSRHMHREREGL
jgi:putative membrane protein